MYSILMNHKMVGLLLYFIKFVITTHSDMSSIHNDNPHAKSSTSSNNESSEETSTADESNRKRTGKYEYRDRFEIYNEKSEILRKSLEFASINKMVDNLPPWTDSNPGSKSIFSKPQGAFSPHFNPVLSVIKEGLSTLSAKMKCSTETATSLGIMIVDLLKIINILDTYDDNQNSQYVDVVHAIYLKMRILAGIDTKYGKLKEESIKDMEKALSRFDSIVSQIME